MGKCGGKGFPAALLKRKTAKGTGAKGSGQMVTDEEMADEEMAELAGRRKSKCLTGLRHNRRLLSAFRTHEQMCFKALLDLEEAVLDHHIDEVDD